MSRVKRGVTSHRRHKKILSLTKGHAGQRHRQEVFRRHHVGRQRHDRQRPRHDSSNRDVRGEIGH